MKPELLCNYTSTINQGFIPEIHNMTHQSDTFQVINLKQPSSWVVPEPLVNGMNNFTGKTYTHLSIVKENQTKVEKEVEGNELPNEIIDMVMAHTNEIDLQNLIPFDIVSEIVKEETVTADKEFEELLKLNATDNQQVLNLAEYLACLTPPSDHSIEQELNNHVQIVPGSINSNQIPVVSDLYEPVTPVMFPDNHTENENHFHLTELKPKHSSGDQNLSALNYPEPLNNLNIPSTVEEKFIVLPLVEVKSSFNIEKQKTLSSKHPRKHRKTDFQETNANTHKLSKPTVEMGFLLNSQSPFTNDNSNSTSSSKDGDWESTPNKRARWSIPGGVCNGKQEKNNFSSKRSREKKAQIEKENEEKCKQLEIENEELKMKSMELQQKIDELFKHQSNLLVHMTELLEKNF